LLSSWKLWTLYTLSSTGGDATCLSSASSAFFTPAENEEEEEGRRMRRRGRSRRSSGNEKTLIREANERDGTGSGSEQRGREGGWEAMDGEGRRL